MPYDKEQFSQYPEIGITSDMRQVFLCGATHESSEFRSLAEAITHPRTGTKCLVKWENPDAPKNIDELTINLLNSTVLLVLVTPSLLNAKGITKLGNTILLKFLNR